GSAAWARCEQQQCARPLFFARAELAERGQRGLETRHADGESSRRDVLAEEAADEPVVASAAADRSEAYRLDVLVGDQDPQLGLVDRPGVIFEAAHDGRIGPDDTAVIN